MKELIERQAAIEAVEPILKSILQGNSFKAINVMDEIRKVPTVEPKTGKWVDCGTSPHWKCDQCGAKMDEVVV